MIYKILVSQCFRSSEKAWLIFMRLLTSTVSHYINKLPVVFGFTRVNFFFIYLFRYNESTIKCRIFLEILKENNFVLHNFSVTLTHTREQETRKLSKGTIFPFTQHFSLIGTPLLLVIARCIDRPNWYTYIDGEMLYRL